MSLWRILREPVLHDTRSNLARSSARVPESLRGPRQMLGRGGNGCGATIGLLPRCDFACVGCYLGDGANRTPPAPLEEIKEQIRTLRPSLGNAGNLQITDGEATLRPVEDLIELLQYARSLDLIPMLMTHGDSFRRHPRLLERLVREGGLVELSIHIDTTQRGRLGPAYKRARTEEELMPLRDEFVAIVRDVEQRTGTRLRVATTMTVTADNLAGVPAVMRWLAGSGDAFRLVSFQPAAQVGRTLPGLGGMVSPAALWAKIAEGLYGAGNRDGEELLSRGYVHLGHPDCTRYLPGVLVRGGDGDARFQPIRVDGDPASTRFYDGFLDRFGGVTFRLDSPWERLVRLLGLALQAPRFVLGSLGPFVIYWLRQGDARHPIRFAARLVTGRATVQPLVIVSHHFMSCAEAETPRGQERLDLCVFHVPIDGALTPMCQVNTGTARDAVYAQLARHGTTRLTPRQEVS